MTTLPTNGWLAPLKAPRSERASDVIQGNTRYPLCTFLPRCQQTACAEFSAPISWCHCMILIETVTAENNHHVPRWFSCLQSTWAHYPSIGAFQPSTAGYRLCATPPDAECGVAHLLQLLQLLRLDERLRLRQHATPTSTLHISSLFNSGRVVSDRWFKRPP